MTYKKPLLVSLLALLPVIIVVSILVSKVGAFTAYGKPDHTFYWGGNYSGDGGARNQLIPCDGTASAFHPGDASKQAFINKLKAYYNGGSGCTDSDTKKINKVGARTILSLLTDAGWGNEGSFTELENIFDDPDLTIDWKNNYVNTTGYNMAEKFNDSKGYHDNFFGYDPASPTDSIVIKYNGTKALVIKSDCGNPWDTIRPDVIDKPWKAVPDVSVDKNTIGVGERAYFSLSSTVTQGPLGRASTLSYLKSDAWSGSGDLGTLPSGSNVGRSINYSNVLSVQGTSSNIGRTYCVTARSIPGYGVDGTIKGNLSDGPACVTVKGTNDPCRPIRTQITAATYPGINNGRSGSANVYSVSYTPSYRASTDVYSDPTVYVGTNIWQTRDLTRLNTDGNLHNKTLTDTTNHVVSMSAVDWRFYDRIERQTRYWIPATYKTVTDYSNCIAKDKKGNCTKYGTKRVVDVAAHWSAWSGWSNYRTINSYTAPSVPSNTDSAQYQLISHLVYQYTDVRYSDGTVTRKVSGQVASYTNATGTSRTYTLHHPNANVPCFDYMINTSINNFGNTMESGASIGINPSVSSRSYTQANLNSFWSNYRTHTKSKNTYWQVTKMVIQPGRPLPNTAPSSVNSAVNPCQYYDPANISTCTVQQSGSTVVSTSGSTSSNLSSTFTVPDVRAGTKICFAFSIRPDRSDPSNFSFTPDSLYWQHSAFSASANCILVVKKPKVQVWGGDIEVGKTLSSAAARTSIVETSQSVKSGTMYGSWGEYGLLATGRVNGMASGSALSGGRPGANSCTIAQLTFANSSPGMKSCNGSYFGNYRYGVNMKNLTGYFTTATNTLTAGTFGLNSSTSGIYSSTVPNINITGGTLSRTVVLNAPNSNVTISGNISYANGNISSLTDIPQMLIIARNIYINSGVSRVDSWLIAPEGKVNTCIEGGERTPLTVFTCETPLLINGPVMANQLYLRRTAGSNPASESGDPAEVINLRSDAYLWMYSLSKGDNRIRNTYVVELPPRL